MSSEKRTTGLVNVDPLEIYDEYNRQYVGTRRRPVGGHGTFPLLSEVDGTPCVLSPYFFGAIHIFVLMHILYSLDDWSNFR